MFINSGIQNTLMESGVIQDGFLEERWSLKDEQDFGQGKRRGKRLSQARQGQDKKEYNLTRLCDEFIPSFVLYCIYLWFVY